MEEKEIRIEGRLAQIGTQTSPESLSEDMNPMQMFLGAIAKVNLQIQDSNEDCNSLPSSDFPETCKMGDKSEM